MTKLSYDERQQLNMKNWWNRFDHLKQPPNQKKRFQPDDISDADFTVTNKNYVENKK